MTNLPLSGRKIEGAEGSLPLAAGNVAAHNAKVKKATSKRVDDDAGASDRRDSLCITTLPRTGNFCRESVRGEIRRGHSDQRKPSMTFFGKELQGFQAGGFSTTK
jgi:hypothetical protein